MSEPPYPRSSVHGVLTRTPLAPPSSASTGASPGPAIRELVAPRGLPGGSPPFSAARARGLNPRRRGLSFPGSRRRRPSPWTADASSPWPGATSPRTSCSETPGSSTCSGAASRRPTWPWPRAGSPGWAPGTGAGRRWTPPAGCSAPGSSTPTCTWRARCSTPGSSPGPWPAGASPRPSRTPTRSPTSRASRACAGSWPKAGAGPASSSSPCPPACRPPIWPPRGPGSSPKTWPPSGNSPAWWGSGSSWTWPARCGGIPGSSPSSPWGSTGSTATPRGSRAGPSTPTSPSAPPPTTRPPAPWRPGRSWPGGCAS